MGLMTAIEVGASGLTAQRRRMEVLVSNLVNANTTQKPGVEPFRRKDVVFTSYTPEQSFGSMFDNAVQGVEISDVITDPNTTPDKRFEPNNPNADKDGYVVYPNISPMTEMFNVVDATRSYEANLQAVNMAKEMQQKTLEMLK
jgi:flagellar basal-body rod protein FlgC